MAYYGEPMLQGDYEDIAEHPTSTSAYVAQKFSSGFDAFRNMLGSEEILAADPQYLHDPAYIREHGEPPPVPKISVEEARRRVKEAGLEGEMGNLGSADVNIDALDIMMRHARERQYRAAQIARGPSGFVPGVLGVGAEFLGSALDPLNVAAFSIPVVGVAGSP